MDRALLSRVTGVHFDAAQLRPGLLKDYKRVRVAKVTYPAIFGSVGNEVEGVIVHGITRSIMSLLDDFEHEEYDRQNVVVELINGRSVDAMAYIAGPNMVLDEDAWDFQVWRRCHQQQFLENLKA